MEIYKSLNNTNEDPKGKRSLRAFSLQSADRHLAISFSQPSAHPLGLRNKYFILAADSENPILKIFFIPLFAA